MPNHLAQTRVRDRLARCVLAFSPRSALDARRAGYVPYGTPQFPRRGGAVLNPSGTTTDYLLRNINGRLRGLATVSIQAEFQPAFAVGDNEWHHICATDLATRFAIQKTNVNRLYVYMGGTLLTQILAPDLAAAWNEYGRNVLTVSGTSGANDIWLNDTHLLVAGATAWAPANSVLLGIGSNETGGAGSLFEGWMRSLRIYNGLLTEADHLAEWRRAS